MAYSCDAFTRDKRDIRDRDKKATTKETRDERETSKTLAKD